MQLEELEMLQCVYGDDIVLKSVSPRIVFSIRVLSTAPGVSGALADAFVDPDMPYVLDLGFVFPEEYPEKRPLQFSIDCNKITRAERDEVLRAVNETMQLYAGIPCVQAVVEAARTAALDIRRELSDEQLAEELQKATSNEEELQAIDWATGELCLGRRCIYYHHILSQHKRQCIQRWSRSLRLAGFCKIGYPGILIFEGPEIACVEMVRALQRLRWKLMVVRGEERFETKKTGVPFDSLRAVLHEGVRETVDASEIGEWCRTCGLEALFKTSMKIYS
jgi:hypothetical protein